jgi:cytochrome b subunit of formate dehydrogenase
VGIVLLVTGYVIYGIIAHYVSSLCLSYQSLSLHNFMDFIQIHMYFDFCSIPSFLFAILYSGIL